MLVLTCLVSRHFVTFILRIIYSNYVNYVKLEDNRISSCKIITPNFEKPSEVDT